MAGLKRGKWRLSLELYQRDAGRSNADARGVHRRLSLEQLEDRCLLAADLLNPSALGATSGALDRVPDDVSLPEMVVGGFHLTTTASKMPVYLNELGTAGDVQPELIQSGSLINMDAF